MTTDFTPIKGDAGSWTRDKDVRVLSEERQDEITALLMGRRVVKVDSEHLLLDNCTVIKAIGHDGGCSCSAGDYHLSVLNGIDNVITRVDFDYRLASDEDDGEGFYRVFVYADNEQVNLMQFDGSDGNGYYGTGFEILVRDATPAAPGA